ncbi:AAA family ATPase [Nocardia sp. NPDC047038]|uniref:ATP-binding protein n=1 Tax=Nocardia sp. NPDC047038 TaxID=3154338 RepID=UPI0033DFD249
MLRSFCLVLAGGLMALISASGAESAKLVGRSSELLSIGKLLADAQSGAVGAIAVVGEPGIGKTRMLLELSERATAAGFEVLTGRGAELERDVPFGMVIEALDQKFGALSADVTTSMGPEQFSELATVLPSLSGRGGRNISRLEIERFEFHRAVRATFGLLVRVRPLVLVLDDVHWADPASVELIGHLLRRGLVPGMVLALAYRTRQAPPLLLDAVARASRESQLYEFELAPLTIAEAAEALGERVDSRTVRLLHSETGGNPFYLEQLSRTVQRGTLAPVTAEGAGEDRETGIPAAVRATIVRELAGLTDKTLKVLQAGAVASDPFNIDLVTKISDFDEGLVSNCLDELVGVDLVRTTTTAGQFRFRHPIVRRVVYDEAMPAWRFGAHKRAARALAMRGAPLIVQAHHVERSASPGDEEAVVTLTAAGQAVVSRAPAAAAGWFKAALELLPESGGMEQRLSLIVSMAGALAYSGRMHDSRSALEQALALVPVDSFSDRARIIGMIARADHSLGRADEVRDLITTALDQTTPGTAEAVKLHLELAENQQMRGQWESAVATAALARAEAETLGDRPLFVAGSSCLAWFTSALGDVDQAQMLADSVANSVDTDNLSPTPEFLDALANLVFTEIALSRFRSADRHAERGLEVSRASGHGHFVGRFMLGAATTKMYFGQLREAQRTIESTVEAAILLGNDQLLASAEAIRCWIETLRGNLSAALTAGRAAVRAANRVPQAHYAWLARACYGQALIEGGEFERGRKEIISLGGLELPGMSPLARPVFQLQLVNAELATGRIDSAEAIVRRIEDSPLTLLSHKGQAFQGRALVQAASGDFRAAATSARWACEYFDAVEMCVWAARARIIGGRALAQANDTGAAIRELELAYGILRETGAARFANAAAKELRSLGRRVQRRPTPDAAADPAGLTDRECGVASLVAEGYTNREIAAELFISPKTVEKHLARVFEKLGVSTRAGVAGAINLRRVKQH